jgi:hypothetical protein
MVDVAKTRRILLLAMFLLALGALMLHVNIHTPLVEDGQTGTVKLNFTNSVAAIFGLLDVVLVTFLFARKKTAAYGYLLNGMLVIYGTVFMTHCGIVKVGGPEVPIVNYIFHPVLPNVIMAWADFFAGAMLYKLWFMEAPKPHVQPQVSTEPV